MPHEFRDLVSELKGKGAHSDKLFERHDELDDKIKDAEEGRTFLSDAGISILKKEKLHVKDELAQYLADYKK